MCRPWSDTTVSTQEDAGSGDVKPFGAEGVHGQKDRDGARPPRDPQEESGDGDEIHDLCAIGWREAHDGGVDLDLAVGGEVSLSAATGLRAPVEVGRPYPRP